MSLARIHRLGLHARARTRWCRLARLGNSFPILHHAHKRPHKPAGWLCALAASIPPKDRAMALSGICVDPGGHPITSGLSNR